jgi:hypothetical protein
MLDAYIIDRIRRERERARQKDYGVPLHIEPPRGPDLPDEPFERRREEEEPKRGSIVIDFSI